MVRLAAPLVLAEVGWMMMGVVDTMAVGRVSAYAIGAVSLGTSLFYTIGIFASGLLLGLDTLVAQGFGAGDLRGLPALADQRYVACDFSDRAGDGASGSSSHSAARPAWALIRRCSRDTRPYMHALTGAPRRC